MRLNLVAGAYAAWLVATEVLFYIFNTADDSTALQLAALLGIIPAAIQLLLLGFNPYGVVAPVRMALCFVLIALISYLGDAYWTSLIWVASLVFTFGIVTLVAGSPDERLIRNIAVFYTIPAALFLLFVSATGEHEWGRLRAHGIEPDWWGFMAAGMAMAGLAHRSRLLAAFCVGVGFYVANDASARSDMLAMLAGLLVVGSLQLRTIRGPRLVMAIAISLVALVVFLLFLPTITDTVTNAVVSTMKVDDPNRGLGTGFTGRDVAWGSAIRIWLKSPLFGVGFHQAGLFTADGAPSHSIYLATLAETGIFGFIWYISFLGVSLHAALRIGEPCSRNAAVSTIVAYAAIGLLDTHGLSGANPFSLYWEMCCFFALRHASVQRFYRHISSGPTIVSAQPMGAR